MQHFSGRRCSTSVTSHVPIFGAFSAIRGCIIKRKCYLEENQVSVLVKMGLMFEDYALGTHIVIP